MFQRFFSTNKQIEIRFRITPLAWSVNASRSFFVALSLLVLFFSLPVQAASRSNVKPKFRSTDYQASVVSLSAPSSLRAGEDATVTVTLKNIGAAPWLKSGANFISLYNWNRATKKEITSVFATSVWSNAKRPTGLSVAAVNPGQSVSLTFPIRAPQTAGSYREEFILTAENAAWIKYSWFTLEIKVANGSIAVTPSSSLPTNLPAYQPTSLPTDFLPSSSSTDWSAKLIDRGGSEWQVEPDGQALVDVAFRNQGTRSWTRDGKAYVSLYASDGRKERKSAFRDAGWPTEVQAAKLKEKEVKPGEVGHFRLILHGPQTAGAFVEKFSLAAEDTAWMNDGQVEFPVRVPMTDGLALLAPPLDLPDGDIIPNDNTSSGRASAYQAMPDAVLNGAVSGIGYSRQLITIGFKNTGNVYWYSRSLRMKALFPAAVGGGPIIHDDSWNNPYEPIRMDAETRPGDVGPLQFHVRLPPKKGVYHASFQLYVDNLPVEGGVIDIPLTVTADAPVSKVIPAPKSTAPKVTTPAPVTVSPPLPIIEAVPLTGDISSLPAEPIIRVGLYKATDNRMTVRATYSPLVVTKSGQTLCRLNIGEAATVTFDPTQNQYRLEGASCSAQTPEVILFKAEDGISPMEIADYSRPVGWLPGANDNTFRAQLELRSTGPDRVWIINELPIEWYLKGIAETSNVSPQQFQRTLLVAARTYATYHVQRNTKHADDKFTVDAHLDQVYRGYGSESRTPNVVSAVEATRGQIVTYNGKLAITPYYSRSDGRTRAWSEVWYGNPYPWLVSVPVPWDNGKTLWGHGVGMSATGALAMAREGKDYQEILKYFYVGTEIRRAYR